MENLFNVKQKLLSIITEADKIILSRHRRPDGDAVGSTIGLREILRASFPGKDVRVINGDYGEYTRFIGQEDPQEPDDFYRDALVIVLDTPDFERCSNPKVSLARTLIRIDHHIDNTPFGDFAWIEPERSSVAEMITDFYVTFRDTLMLPQSAAYALYAGIVTDSGRFYFDSTSGDTLRLAAVLLDTGIDTDNILSNLYMEAPDYLHYQAYVYDHIQYTPNGAAYIFVDRAMQDSFRLTEEEAANTVEFLSKIRGSLIWAVFIDYGYAIRVRLRSRYVAVSELANQYRGGGHARAAGSTVYSEEEMQQLLADADLLLAEYKQTHTGWI